MFFKKYFGDKGFWRVALRLAIPVALQQLLIASFSLVDTLMVSQLGENELAAMGMTGQWAMLFNVTLFGFCSAASMFVSQYFGAKDEKGIRRTCGMSLLCGAIPMVIFVSIQVIAPQMVVGFFTDDALIASLGNTYLRIAIWSYPAVYLSNILSAVIRACEHVKLPMAVSGFTAILNGVLNYIFIFGKLGLPALGIAGAAVATCISSWIGPLLLILFSLAQKHIIWAKPKEIFTFSKQHLLYYFKRAMPIVCNEFAWGLGTLVLATILSNYSTSGYTAKTILGTFENISFVFAVGLCNAACIMIGKSVGEGKTERAVTDAKRFAMLIPAYAAILGVIMIIFRQYLVQIFNMEGNIETATLSLASLLMVIFAIELPIRYTHYIQIVGIFRSGGDTVAGAILDSFALWAMSIPATYLATHVFHWSFPVVFACMLVAEDHLKSVMCIRHFFSMKWIKPVTEEGKAGLAKWLSLQKANKETGS